MDIRRLFGISVLMSSIAVGVVTKLYIWPQLRSMRPDAGLVPLVVPHMFRFIGLSFLVPGVVTPSLQRLQPGFAKPAAYDLVAAVLAIIATLALSVQASWAAAIVWIFNIWVPPIYCTESIRARSGCASALDR